MSVLLRRLWLLVMCVAAMVSGCGGGGDSTVTTITGGGSTGPRSGPEVAVSFVQRSNNLSVVVDGGPPTFSLVQAQANILYATVTVCAPGSSTDCVTIDHVQVDTGSVGLRVLASKVKSLALPAVELVPGAARAHECYPFVVGGLWGPNVVADVRLGQQLATVLPIQLIEDDVNAALKVPLDCSNAVNGAVLDSATKLGSNGILGIGSVTLDCGQICLLGNYAGTYIQYYSCPVGAASTAACTAAAVPANLQVYNPVAALPVDNNGVVLVLPQVTGLGASKASGELIFGINTQVAGNTTADNQLAAGARRIYLGVQYASNPDSYLNVTTTYAGLTIQNSYLDTGTNGLFFSDASITRCIGSTWYCPASTLAKTAVMSDGDNPLNNLVNVNFSIGNADAYFSTVNTALGDLGGAHPAAQAAAPSFAWGLPFFFGRRVFLSIWQQAGALTGPWYSF
jgi:hypothetical protein